MSDELNTRRSTAVVTHCLMSFSQTMFHWQLGHRRTGGRFFRNHVVGTMPITPMVSETYLSEHGNNTPYFLIPTAAVAVLTWYFLSLVLFITTIVTLTVSFVAHVHLDAQYHIGDPWLGRFPMVQTEAGAAFRPKMVEKFNDPRAT